MATPQRTGQFHVPCHEHHVEMRLTDIVPQTIAPKHGDLALEMTPRVTCPRDGQPMYLAELNPEKRSFRPWRCPQCDSSRTNEERPVKETL